MHGENGVCSVFKGLWRQSCSLQSSRICLCIFCCGAAGVAALWCSKSTSQVNPILWKSEPLLCLGKTRGLSDKTPNKHEILLLIFILRIKDQKPGILEKKKNCMQCACACAQRIICVGDVGRLRRKHSSSGWALFVELFYQPMTHMSSTVGWNWKFFEPRWNFLFCSGFLLPSFNAALLNQVWCYFSELWVHPGQQAAGRAGHVTVTTAAQVPDSGCFFIYFELLCRTGARPQHKPALWEPCQTHTIVKILLSLLHFPPNEGWCVEA